MSAMNQNLRDGIAMRGDLTIVVTDVVTGEQKRRIEIRNKITFLAADVLVELLAQRGADPVPADGQIYSLRVGTGGTAASRADTNLGAVVDGVIIGDVGKVTGVPGELEFSITLPSVSAANGFTLQEAGLFTKGGAAGALDAPGVNPGDPRLFARQIHPPIPKSAAISIAYTWRIAFTA